MQKVEFKIDYTRPQETFTLKHEDDPLRVFMTGEMIRFAQTFEREILADMILGVKPLVMPVTEKETRHIQRNMGIEPARLKRLTEPYLSKPVIGVLWPPDNREMTIVDGNHRYVRRFHRNKKDILVFAFRHPFWENFLLPDSVVAEVSKNRDLLKADSGILEFEKQYGALS